MGATWSFFLLAFLLILSSSSQAQPQNLTFAYSSFDSSSTDNLTRSGSAGFSLGALQITPETRKGLTYVANKSGRVLFNQPFNLWQPASAPSNNNTTANLTASFNTAFTINIGRVANNTPGEGFAFIIAPTLDGPPANSDGQYLGLTNSTLDGNASNYIVAVEFDTVKQPFDPDDNHVGLDINSVRSSANTSLTPFGIRISPEKDTNYTVWIDYDGVKKHIQVYMALQNQSKPAAAVLKSPLDLSLYVLQQSYFGFAASTAATNLELNCVLAWNLTIDALPGNDKPESKGMAAWELGLAIALPLVAAMVISGVLIWYCYVKRRKVGAGPSPLAGTLRSLPGTPREFEFKVLRKATNNFDEGLKLGQGGFGIVYKGVIPEENTEVAVKKFSRDNIKGQDDFLAELSIINRLRHKHLVRLLGWCHQNGMLLLVYDYMPNGSLDQHLYCGPKRPILTWGHRYNILTGVASALHYLHNEYDQKVVHRDLKASNVLLDANFNARLGDFGLARALDTDKTSYIDVELGGIAGTVGYIAPECFHTGKATSESDVFAFGAVVLEVVCGRRPRCDLSGFQFLADWVWKLHREDRILDAVDSQLDGQFVREDAVRLLLLGLACTHPLPKERPKTAAIVQIVSRSLAPPVVPPFKPAFVWPSGPVDDEDCTESMTSTIISSQYGSSAGWTPRVSDQSKT